MIFSTTDSLRYIKTCLKHIEEYESTTHTVLPLIILLGNEAGTPESEIRYLRNEGHNMANRYIMRDEILLFKKQFVLAFKS